MFSRFTFRWTAVLLAVSASAALAANSGTYTLPNEDTYLESYQLKDPNSGAIISDFQTTNYGHNGAVKAVSNYSDPTDTTATRPGYSLVHGLIKLPQTFFDNLPAGGIGNATLEYRVRRNDFLNGRGVELHPLTRSFIGGGGGSAGDTQNGTLNSSLSSPGADWKTADSVTPWTTPGGDYSAATILGTFRGTAPIYLDWNITPWINDPTLRESLRTNGLLIKVTNETTYVANDFVSLWSGDSANPPTVSFVVPEPMMASVAGLAVWMSRRRSER